MVRRRGIRWTRKNRPEEDPLTWLLAGALDLLYWGVDRVAGRYIVAVIRRLPHR